MTLMTHVLSWHPNFLIRYYVICLGFETGAKLFKCSTICPMLGLPHDSGQCHRPRQLWLRVPCLFAFDCFRTWSFHRVWTCLASLDITIPAKKAEGLHNKTWVNTFNHHIPSTNLLNKRLPHDCFHSKQILTVRNEDMKWYFYAYICITSSSNQHKSRLLEHCPGIYKEVIFYSNEATAPRERCCQCWLMLHLKDTICITLRVQGSRMFLDLLKLFVWTRVNGVWRWHIIQGWQTWFYAYYKKTCMRCWSNSSISSHDSTTCYRLFALFCLYPPGPCKTALHSDCLISKAMARRFFGLRHLQT